MKVRHDVDATTLPKSKKVAAGLALVALLATGLSPAAPVMAKARHDAMHVPTR